MTGQRSVPTDIPRQHLITTERHDEKEEQRNRQGTQENNTNPFPNVLLGDFEEAKG